MHRSQNRHVSYRNFLATYLPLHYHISPFFFSCFHLLRCLSFRTMSFTPHYNNTKCHRLLPFFPIALIAFNFLALFVNLTAALPLAIVLSSFFLRASRIYAVINKDQVPYPSIYTLNCRGQTCIISLYTERFICSLL